MLFCLIAQTTIESVKEKWRGMKGAVLNPLTALHKTGGGLPPDPITLEAIILPFLCQGTNLVSGIGADEKSFKSNS